MAFPGSSAAVIHDGILNHTPVPVMQVSNGLSTKAGRNHREGAGKGPQAPLSSAADIRTDLERLKRDTESAKDTRSMRPHQLVWGNNEESGGRRLYWAMVLAVAALAGGYFYFHRTPRLTDKDTIVLADFTNTTGDAVFDSTLREGLAGQLEQSPFLRICARATNPANATSNGSITRCEAQPRDCA